ncbi:twin-arginine translocase subunit TatC [Myxococcota bacterium]|nr:twin-arginine translocase subunit TatC [Myxococcota bacterium]MBU1383008.1 twin-arginine translocase subunit TatC [Myxococcota bacterium]MBU1498837.1 twin-arginine translocase subunit TatC [Myxococcota bacterium]
MDDTRQTLASHLRELAYRIRLILIWLVAGFTAAFIFKEPLFEILVAPLSPAMNDNPNLHFASPIEPFFTYLWLSLRAGVLFAVPGIIYNLWAFIAPGLKVKEKRFVFLITFFGAIFFILGVLFAYFIVFPYGFKFLIDFAAESPGNIKLIPHISEFIKEVYNYTPVLADGSSAVSLNATIMMGEYLKLMINLLMAFGIVFELPLVVYFLATSEIVSTLALMKFFRYFVVIAFTVSAILTPPDVVTQVMMAVPLILMYLLSVGVAHLVLMRRRKN